MTALLTALFWLWCAIWWAHMLVVIVSWLRHDRPQCRSLYESGALVCLVISALVFAPLWSPTLRLFAPEPRA
jgi:glucan phosphoethanolaminetransferase (alkaline phosphatase superfamily)